MFRRFLEWIGWDTYEDHDVDEYEHIYELGGLLDNMKPVRTPLLEAIEDDAA